MNTSPFAEHPLPEPAGLSRRTMVGAGAAGLALALFARAYRPGLGPGCHTVSRRFAARRGDHADN